MARIRALEEEDVSADYRVHFEEDRSAFGTVLNSTGFSAYCPQIMRAAKALGKAVEGSGQVSRELRCLLNVRAAAMVGCPF